MSWKPISTAPHNTEILILTRGGEIDVASDGYEPARFIRNARGQDVWHEEWYWWSCPHLSGPDAEWSLHYDEIVGWQPLPSRESPLRETIEVDKISGLAKGILGMEPKRNEP